MQGQQENGIVVAVVADLDDPERLGRVRVRYPDGSIVAISPGTSLLEASRAAGIPHAAVCGGRGRC